MKELAVDMLLRDHGLRATPQRAVVIEALRGLSHPDAEAVFDYAQKRQSSVSLATVYNVLDRLKDAGLVALLEFHGRRYFDMRVEHHDHVHCRSCGRLADAIRHSETRIVTPPITSWMIEDQSLVWEGVCPECQQA